MSETRQFEPYPWASLDHVERAAERGLRAARRALEPFADPSTLSAVLSTLLETPIEISVLRIDQRTPEGALSRIGFAALDAGRCVLGVEPALASALLSKLLRRQVPIVHPELTLDPALSGALAAIVIEATRRADAKIALRPSTPLPEAGSVVVHLAVAVAGKPYAAALWVAPRFRPSKERDASELFGRLGNIEVSLPLVVALNLSTPRELSKLGVGAAWCPQQGFWIDSTGRGRGALVARTSSLGVGVELGPEGRIVLRDAEAVPLAATEAMVMDRDNARENSSLAETVLDAPLVVRVELAEVSLPAREWAALQPGDVIETGRRIAEPVLLSAGGRILARGELVNVEGELGVRVMEIVTAS